MPDETAGAMIPEAAIGERRRISLVWLIPIVALVIGGWLAYKAFSERGPTITIQFETASGLEANKTKIKFKEVEIGEVTRIAVSKDLKHVLVTAELVRGSEPYLTDKTRFWVTRPRVTAGRVSGLDTLLSGAYIAVDPVAEGKLVRDFVGLEEPPVYTTDVPGSRYILRAERLGSIGVGSPIYYRQIQAGQVIGYDLDPDGKAISIEIFIAAPYNALVRTTTRFWNSSGVDLRVSSEGVEIDSDALLSVLIGGISFSVPETNGKGFPAEEDQYFPLYANQREAMERFYRYRERYTLYFNGSVRGLTVGASVDLRGIRVGRVVDIHLGLDQEGQRFEMPVLIEVEPERIELEMARNKRIPALVEKGLRAQLKPGNLLTGQLYVDLDFHPDAPPAEVAMHDGKRVFPTVPTPLGTLTAKLNGILESVEGFPLQAIGENLSTAAAGASTLLNSPALTDAIDELSAATGQIHETLEQIDKGALPELTTALEQARSTMAAAEELVSKDSALYAELGSLLRELASAARSIRVMADYLERHPEALIKGKDLR